MILIIVTIIARPYSSYYSNYYFARLSLLLLRSIIDILIIITSLDYRYRYYYHSAFP